MVQAILGKISNDGAFLLGVIIIIIFGGTIAGEFNKYIGKK